MNERVNGNGLLGWILFFGSDEMKGSLTLIRWYNLDWSGKRNNVLNAVFSRVHCAIFFQKQPFFFKI